MTHTNIEPKVYINIKIQVASVALDMLHLQMVGLGILVIEFLLHMNMFAHISVARRIDIPSVLKPEL